MTQGKRDSHRGIDLHLAGPTYSKWAIAGMQLRNGSDAKRKEWVDVRGDSYT